MHHMQYIQFYTHEVHSYRIFAIESAKFHDIMHDSAQPREVHCRLPVHAPRPSYIAYV